MPQAKGRRSGSAARKKSRAPSVKLNLLIDGVFVTDRRLFLPEGRAEVYRGVAKSLLIRSGKEKILVDTGIGSVPGGPKYELLRRHQKIERTKSQGMDKQLAKLGVRPEEITTVVHTHLHNAHSGGNHLFKNAHFFVAKDEFRFIDELMSEDPNQIAYIGENFENLKNLDQTKGEYQVTEEVRVIPTPGHTTGHQSVVISLDGGKKLVYSGDVAPLRENLVERTAMSGYDRGLILRSMERLLEIKDARWVFSHDNTQLSIAKAYAP